MHYPYHRNRNQLSVQSPEGRAAAPLNHLVCEHLEKGDGQ